MRTFSKSICRSIVFLSLLISCIACHENTPTPSTQLLEYGMFTIEVPAHWSQLPAKELNSSKGGIQLDSSDRVNFELGQEVDDLNEYVHIIDSTYAFKGNAKDTAISGNWAKMESLRKSNTTYMTIDGHRAKIITPKKAGDGITGVFIDSLKISAAGWYKFQFSGKDLRPDNQQQFLKAIQSLNFIKTSKPLN